MQIVAPCISRTCFNEKLNLLNATLNFFFLFGSVTEETRANLLLLRGEGDYQLN